MKENEYLKHVIDSLEKSTLTLNRKIEVLESKNTDLIDKLNSITRDIDSRIQPNDPDPKTQTKFSDSKQTFPCGKCCLKFPNKASLKIHKNEMHKTVLKF